MLTRCPNADVVGPAELLHYQLAFAGWSSIWRGGVATVRPHSRDRVRGLIWSVPPSDLARLDGFEGAPWTYCRERVRVRRWSGRMQNVQAYVQDPTFPTMPPSRQYAGRIAGAYRTLGFDTAPLTTAIRKAVADARACGLESWEGTPTG